MLTLISHHSLAISHHSCMQLVHDGFDKDFITEKNIMIMCMTRAGTFGILIDRNKLQLAVVKIRRQYRGRLHRRVG